LRPWPPSPAARGRNGRFSPVAVGFDDRQSDHGRFVMRTAECACGQLTVSCDAEPAKVSLCHCPACQRRTGSTYGVAAFFRRELVRRKGDARTFTRSSDSGHDVTFHFCPACGSTVYWEPHRKPDVIAVAVGAFADPGFPSPSQTVYDEHRHPWVAVRT